MLRKLFIEVLYIHYIAFYKKKGIFIPYKGWCIEYKSMAPLLIIPPLGPSPQRFLGWWLKPPPVTPLIEGVCGNGVRFPCGVQGRAPEADRFPRHAFYS